MVAGDNLDSATCSDADLCGLMRPCTNFTVGSTGFTISVCFGGRDVGAMGRLGRKGSFFAVIAGLFVFAGFIDCDSNSSSEGKSNTSRLAVAARALLEV